MMAKLKVKVFVSENIFKLEEWFNEWTDNSNVDVSVSYILKDPETGNFILSVFYSPFETLKLTPIFKKKENKNERD